MLCRLVSGQFVVMLISRVGLVPDLDSFSGDADGALEIWPETSILPKPLFS